jgi:hypothetical protein
MEPDDLPCSRNARPPKALARVIGTSRRASGWAGKKVARSRRSISPIPEERTSKLGGSIVEPCSQGSRARLSAPRTGG